MLFQTLKKICQAINKQAVQDTEELHNIRLIVSVGVEKSNSYIDNDGVQREGRLQNTIKTYKPMSEKSQGEPASAASSSADDGKMPWKKQ